ncbi:hypothetical protein AYO21_07320 [Fonsecaea monophora]|uniref:Uncharacterized protein n=1 Tax=Fonsecaea monophora TaxID=254056 RepID=A0A177F2M8_9EURO|nr:hypothetical protein AYO21_07320 [Fonsecaea monophora]OAG38498.1 hypothetical protein AYO21_07320 [Fonsecaea monophora]
MAVRTEPARPNIFNCDHALAFEHGIMPAYVQSNQHSPKSSTSPVQTGESSISDQTRQELTSLSQPSLTNFKADPDLPGQFDFEFVHPPSFGLQLCRPAQVVGHKAEEKGSYFEHRSVWRRSQSFSPSAQRVSLESTHHSDSALLQNFAMDDLASHSSPEPRTTRPIYPDLPSAYAQIQGRRTASLQPVSSSRSATRFPLSSSSSSSEDEDYEHLPFENDAIELKNLPYRKVHSAQGILREAVYHQASSAVLETTVDNGDPDLDCRRGSTTLDDIVSQYADANLTGYQTHNIRIDDGAYVEPEPLNCVTDSKSANDAACFGTPKTRQGYVVSGNQLHEPYQHRAENQLPRNHDGFGAIDDDDEEWITVPETSRSGFLTPSKLRFRLAKRGTADTSDTTLTGRGSPASPWDPLSSAKQSERRPQQQYKDPLNLKRHHHSPSQKPYRETALGCRQPLHKESSTLKTGGQVVDADGRVCRLDSAGAPAVKAQHHSQPKPRPLNQVSSTHLTPLSHSTRSATLSSSRRVQSALQSSSLLPRIPDDTLVSSFLSPKTMTFSNGTPRATAENTLTIPSIYDDSLNSIASAMENPHFTDKTRQSLITSANNRNFVGEQVEGDKTESAAICDIFASSSDHSFVQRHNIEGTYIASGDAEALAARHYNEGGYRFNDADISRFLRDSRLLRQRLDDRHKHENNDAISRQQRVLVTGSSIANVSSDSTMLNRLLHARTSSSSHYSTIDDPARITGQVTHKFKQFLSSSGTGTGTADSANSEYSSLGSVHTSTNSTSRSLVIQEPDENFDTCDAIIYCHRCPSFPLSPEVLGVVSLENLGRVPFERLQLSHDGKWLEKGWCFLHERMEYSHAVLAGNEAAISEDLRSVQRKAGRLLLVLGAATFLVGGWTLIQSIGEGGPLATSAMADLTRVLAGGEEGVVCCVHPRDAAMAQAIEKAAVSVVVLVVIGVLAVLSWAAATI